MKSSSQRENFREASSRSMKVWNKQSWSPVQSGGGNYLQVNLTSVEQGEVYLQRCWRLGLTSGTGCYFLTAADKGLALRDHPEWNLMAYSLRLYKDPWFLFDQFTLQRLRPLISDPFNFNWINIHTTFMAHYFKNFTRIKEVNFFISTLEILKAV